MTNMKNMPQELHMVNNMEYKHIPVLLEETIDGLNVKKDGIYVDGTLGRGGHSSEVLKKLTTGHLYCFDQDKQAIIESEPRLKEISSSYTLINTNFKNMKEELNKLGVYEVDGIMFDLGVSSAQFDESDRGFSYRFDARLDMRMNQSASLSAYDVVNKYSLNELTKIIRDYGEDKFAYQITREIVKTREVKAIETTFELVDVIKQALPSKILRQKGHPAKQTFQALRIAVNDELRVFETSINDALDMMNKGGRATVITFHSLEDRICKNVFKERSTIDIPKGVPMIINQEAPFNLVTRRPVLPSEAELEENNRAHSAKMRVIEKN